MTGRGMQYQAAEVESLLERGRTESALMPPEESVAAMEAMDQVRATIGVRSRARSRPARVSQLRGFVRGLIGHTS